MGYSPWGCKESDTTERLHLPSFLPSFTNPGTPGAAFEIHHYVHTGAPLPDSDQCPAILSRPEKVKKERYRKVIFSCFIFPFLLEIYQLIQKKSIFFHLRTLYAASLILSKLIPTFKTNNEAQEDNLLPCKAI